MPVPALELESGPAAAEVSELVWKAVALAKETHCFIRYERSFFRPLLPKTA